MIIKSTWLACLLFIGFSAMAQSDLLVLKKKGKTVRSFYPGNEIIFTSDIRPYRAIISRIDNDSIYLVQYDIRKTPTMAGSVIIDTVAEYHYGLNYKDIRSFQKERKGFDWAGSGYGIFGGGIIITAAGLATWIFSRPDTRYYARPALVITAAALAGVGYLLMHTGNKKIILGKKYSLQYIKMR